MSIPVLDIAQMRSWEQDSWAAGKVESEVIQQAGKQVGLHICPFIQMDDRILVIAGTGHNGDDARVAADNIPLHKAKILNISDPAQSLSALEEQLQTRPDWIIDGLFGIGLNRLLDERWIALVDRINRSGIPVIAVDIPSGLNGDTGQPMGAAIRATVTITLGAPKKGLLAPSAWPYVGRLVVAPDIGLIPCPHTSKLQWLLDSDFSHFPPRREPHSHKGTHGHAILIAGNQGYHGAAVLAARAAERAQPGLITLNTMPSVYVPVACQLQATMVHPWDSTTELPDSATALMVGPGLAGPSLPYGLNAWVRQAWNALPMPMIVDASALDWLAQGPIRSNDLRVITPHPGEAARMLKASVQEIQADRPKAAARLSELFGHCWVVLKGHQTVICNCDGPCYINPSGNPYMAQGGSGDILAGYMAGLLAQPPLRTEPWKPLAYAVWKHGHAGDLCQVGEKSWTIAEILPHL